jgi:hypothetical protein
VTIRINLFIVWRFDRDFVLSPWTVVEKLECLTNVTRVTPVGLTTMLGRLGYLVMVEKHFEDPMGDTREGNNPW